MDCEAGSHGRESSLDIDLVIGWTKIGTMHAVTGVAQCPPMSGVLMVGGKRGPEGTAGVASCWLDPDMAKGAVTQYLAVCHTIEGNTAGEAQACHPRFPVKSARPPQQHLLGHRLH